MFSIPAKRRPPGTDNPLTTSARRSGGRLGGQFCGFPPSSPPHPTYDLMPPRFFSSGCCRDRLAPAAVPFPPSFLSFLPSPFFVPICPSDPDRNGLVTRNNRSTMPQHACGPVASFPDAHLVISACYVRVRGCDLFAGSGQCSASYTSRMRPCTQHNQVPNNNSECR